MTLVTLAALLLLQSGPAADPMAKANELIEGDADPATFDYGAVRFAENGKAAWAAMSALDDHAQTMVDVPATRETNSVVSLPGKSTCDISAILGGIRDAKSFDSYAEYASARREASRLIEATTGNLDGEIAKSREQVDKPAARQITELHARDQLWRKRIAPVYAREDLSEPAKNYLYNRLMNEACEADQASAAYLRDALKDIDWFTISEYGEAIDHKAWLLVQHSDLALMETVLPRLERLAAQGETAPSNYALLYDRVAYLNDRPQRYGSQGTCRNGVWKAFEMEAPESVNRRRRAMGMSGFKENAARLSADCGS